MKEDDFHIRYFNEGKPVILKNELSQAPAIKRWSIEYFKNKLGNQIISVYVSADGTFPGGPGPYDETKKKIVSMSLHEFFDRIDSDKQHSFILDKNEKLYVYKSPDDFYKAIIDEASYPNFILKNHTTNIKRNVWIGANGNITPPHTDLFYDNFLAQICGVKHVLLWDPAQAPYLYLNPFTETHARQSPINFSSLDLQKYPEFKNANALQGTLNPGDVLFIPDGWIHYIFTEIFSISVNYWFNPKENLQQALSIFLQEFLKLPSGVLKQCLYLANLPSETETMLKNYIP